MSPERRGVLLKGGVADLFYFNFSTLLFNNTNRNCPKRVKRLFLKVKPVKKLDFNNIDCFSGLFDVLTEKE